MTVWAIFDCSDFPPAFDRWQISMRLWNKVQEAERDNKKHKVVKLIKSSTVGTRALRFC